MAQLTKQAMKAREYIYDSLHKHTPGPWHWQIEYDRSVTVVCCNEQLARFSGGLGTDIPNAALIAAAPELLAALQDLVTLVTDNQMYGDEIATAIETIKKARGEA